MTILIIPFFLFLHTMEQESAQVYLQRKYDAARTTDKNKNKKKETWVFEPWVNPSKQTIPPCSVCDDSFRRFKAMHPKPDYWILDHHACCLWHDLYVARMLSIEPDIIIRHKSDDAGDRLRIAHARLMGLPLN